MKSGFSIRLAAHVDLPAILAISNHYALTTPANFAIEPEPLEQWQRDFNATHERHPWFVAAEKPESAEANAPRHFRPTSPEERGVLGFAKASPWKGRCAYHWSAETTVYVRADLRSRGIGSALYAKLIDTMRAQGYRSLIGGITLPNDASVRLHETFGFRKIAQFERIGYKFGMWHDVGYWELHLQDGNAPPDEIRHVRDVLGAQVIT